MKYEISQMSQDQATQKLPIISFFSGCGGFDLGFASAGFSIGLALDIDKSSVESYNHNRENPICQVADLATTNAEEIIKSYRKNSGFSAMAMRCLLCSV